MSSNSAMQEDSSSGDEMDVEQVIEQFNTLQASLATLEKQLAPLLQLPLQSVTAGLPSIQAAKLQAALAYASSALFFIYLHTAGESTENHPVKKELERVKKYLKKIADASAPITTEASSSSSSSSTDKPSLKLDKNAAKRFVSAQLAGQGETPASATKKKKQAAKAGAAASSAIPIDSDSDSDDSSSSEDLEIATATANATKSFSAAAATNPTQAARIAANQPSPHQATQSPMSHKRGTETQKRESNKKSAKRHKAT